MKFDLHKLTQSGYLAQGDTLAFVSDPAKTCTVTKANGLTKVMHQSQPTSLHAFVTTCLGDEPPNHASSWVRSPQGKTLAELWSQYVEEKKAA